MEGLKKIVYYIGISLFISINAESLTDSTLKSVLMGSSILFLFFAMRHLK